MLQYNPSISGSLNITGSLIISNGMIGTVNGIDVQIFSSSINQVITGIQSATGSQEGRLGSIESFTSSTSARLNSIETISASNIARISSLETTSASVDTLNNTQNSRLNALETTSASVDTLNTTQNSRLNSLEIKTGSLATTGSNTFIGTQTITGSLYISSDLIVQGTSSLQNITASAVSIGTNIVNLNTANPAIRYAGLVIGDSGSIGSSGSFFYDSVQDEMIFIHRGANTTVTSSVVLMGPQTYDNIGNETYPTNNRIQKGTGNEHLVDSCIFDNGTTICLTGNTIGTGTACFTNSITASTSLLVVPSTAAVVDILRLNNPAVASSGTRLKFENGYGDLAGIRVIHRDNGSLADDGQIEFQVASNASLDTKMTILNTGQIGMGTISPSAELQINKNCDATLAISNCINVTSGNRGTIAFYNCAVSTVAMIRAAAVTDNVGTELQFHTRPAAGSISQRMTLNASGNLGIGINTPCRSLHVVNVSEQLRLAYDSSNTVYSDFRNDSAGGLLINTSDSYIINYIGGTERMRILNNCSVILQGSLGLCRGGVINMTIPNGNNGGAIRMSCCTGANEGDMYLTGGGGVGILIAGSGRVGIGTVTPSAPLSIRCDSASDASRMDIATCTNNAYRYVSINPGIGMEFCIPGGTSQSPVIQVQGGEPSVGGGSLRFRTGAMGSPSDRLTVTQSGNILACGRISSTLASNGNIQEWVGTIGTVPNNTGWSLFSITHQYDNLAMDIYVFTDVGSFQASKHEVIFGYTSSTYIANGFASAFCIFRTGTTFNETMTICNLSGAQVNNQRIAIRVWGYGVGQNGTGGGNLLTTSCLTRIF